uniref:Reverse transcriptase zinc-binding domain-containing protein n=1 Tax=Noccaea caerulescens TaxID=107243 RepID=A0A1J3HRV0_NOCCA
MTWETIHPRTEPVFWHKAVWFKDHIPRHAFGCWVVARNRMHTRDRLISWGLSVSPLCLLCNAQHENRQHLFFDCAFTAEIWRSYVAAANLSPPTLFEDLLRWIVKPSNDKNLNRIMRLLFQATIYLIWKERNTRLHDNTSRSPSSIKVVINQLMRCKLDPLSRAQPNTPSTISLLTTWFTIFQP